MADTSAKPAPAAEQHLSADSATHGDEKSSTQDGLSSGYQTPMTDVTTPINAAASAKPSGTTTPTATTTATEAEANGPVKKPFDAPMPDCKPPSRPALTEAQNVKYEAVFAAVSTWKTLPVSSAKNAASEPIKDEERMWLSRECLLRYLRATNWSIDNTVKRLLATLTWRREYGVDSLDPEELSIENETGKQVIFGYDNDARPCLYMSPGRQNTEKSERQIQHLVFMLESVIDMMGPGQENSALLINFKNSTSGKSPSVGQGRQVLTILQGHYPERLGKALISDLPWYITTFFKLISPFIDPVTKEKMVFNQPLRNYVPPAQLDKEYGGDVDFKYDHAVYWPSLVAECRKRRAAYRQRWESAGKRVGEYEAYLRGGDQKSLAEVEKVAAAKTDTIPTATEDA